MKMMGTNVGTEIEMYTVKEKDQYIVYTMANDQWQKEEMDDSAADMAENFRILQEVWEDTQNLLRCPKKRWK